MMVNLRIGDDDLANLYAMRDPDVITEADVPDPLTYWVQCEDCGHEDNAGNMVRTVDGSWVCAGCDAKARADYDDYLRAARGW